MIMSTYKYLVVFFITVLVSGLANLLLADLCLADKIYQCPNHPTFTFTNAIIFGQDKPGGIPVLMCLYSSDTIPKQPACYGVPVDRLTQFKGGAASKWNNFECRGTQTECRFSGSKELTYNAYGFENCDFVSVYSSN